MHERDSLTIDRIVCRAESHNLVSKESLQSALGGAAGATVLWLVEVLYKPIPVSWLWAGLAVCVVIFVPCILYLRSIGRDTCGRCLARQMGVGITTVVIVGLTFRIVFDIAT